MIDTEILLDKDASSAGSTKLKIIKKLTLIRMFGYNLATIEKEFSELDYDELKNFTLELGDKVIKNTLISSGSIDQYKEARAQFTSLISNLHQFFLVVFSAQLLQFYTIISDEDFFPQASFLEFQQFLSKNAYKFGELSNNLLFTEYQLIKIYNNLIQFTENSHQLEDFLKNAAGKIHLTNIKNISKQLTIIKDFLNKSIIEEPDNFFLHYLLFACSYTFAKLFELQFIIQEKIVTDKELHDLIDKQEYCLKMAKSALESIEDLNQFYTQRNKEPIKGLEFCLGQSLFHNFPQKDLAEIKNHLLELLVEHTQ
ncbi:hypothetical protein Lade_0858 [Legionella adelaidensis]|uniref:Uncharacterized protein n=1 Tax=Legionella adelaidensis TaxID=45056 RepID=A0A0W0R566_9GAMM|nr:hypothetical protein [Legionella adelaidensis]KTC66200.1 hypothetical protein Lade_0858 [Legionella adelaidensis]